MFAVILIPDFCLQAVLRLEPGLEGQAVALVDSELPKPVVIEVTSAARAQGVSEGLTASQAMARCPHLVSRARSAAREHLASEVLLQCAYAFSPQLEATRPGVCTLSLKGLPLGPETAAMEQWAAKIIEALASLHLEARVGIAITPALALLAAQSDPPGAHLNFCENSAGQSGNLNIEGNHSRQAPHPALSPSDGERVAEGRVRGSQKLSYARQPVRIVRDPAEFIAEMPLTALEPPPEILEILRRWGIRTAGALLALGKERLTERIGPAALELFKRVSPRAIRPLKPAVPPQKYAEEMEFENEIETVEPLWFVLRRFVEQLSRRLELSHQVVAAFHLRLNLASGSAYEHAFHIPAPTGNVDVLFRILQTHLETVRTDSPIVSLRLMATPSRAATHQFGLFETSLRDPNQFAETLGRLTALCGADRVGTPEVLATHRPDAFRLKTPEFGATRKDNPSLFANAASAQGLLLRRLRPAVSARIEFRRQRPVSLRSSIFSGTIAGARGPFLSSGDWWEQNRWSREEWDVQTVDGALYRIFLGADGGGFVEGVYD
jgi:protein ImuB